LEYSASEGGLKFTEVCSLRGPILVRNSVFHAGDVFAVESVSRRASAKNSLSALFISRNVARLGESCLRKCRSLQIVAFEGDSHLVEISTEAFYYCLRLRSIAIPPLVVLLGPRCFSYCKSLQSAIFEPPSRLATICEHAFFDSQSLDRFCRPASVAAIGDAVFEASRIRSIEIEESSVSFRVLNEFLVDFEVRSLIWVIGSPDSIEIPASIETLGPCCCDWKDGLRRVTFESDSNLRSISLAAFAQCRLLESICIPSSVEVLGENCFGSCSRLRTVTFGGESKLRVIEQDAFAGCRSLELVSIPASVEFIGRQPGCSLSFLSPQSHSG
jgi:hypothetical protein